MTVNLDSEPCIKIQEAEIGLGDGIALLGGLAILVARLLIVLRCAVALFVDDAEVVLGDPVAERRRLTIESDRFRAGQGGFRPA